MGLLARSLAFVASVVVIASIASAQEKIKFPISASSKTLGYSPLWVAQKQGFFDRQGLDAQLVLVSGADKSTMALVGGSVSVGSGSIDATIGAVEQGADLIATGGVINGLTHMLMGGKKFKSYEDLRGANIGSSGITSGTAFVLRRMMASKGLQYPKDYNLVNVGPSAQSYLALTANRVVAALIAVPLSSDAAELGYNIIGRADDIIPHYQLTEISTRRSWAEKNRPVMVRFMKAMVLTYRWMFENRYAAVDFLAKEMKLKPAHALKGWEFYTQNRFWPPDGDVTVEGLKTNIRIYAEQTGAKGPLPDLGRYLDQSYLRDATKELEKR